PADHRQLPAAAVRLAPDGRDRLRRGDVVARRQGRPVVGRQGELKQPGQLRRRRRQQKASTHGSVGVRGVCGGKLSTCPAITASYKLAATRCPKQPDFSYTSMMPETGPGRHLSRSESAPGAHDVL